MSSPSDASADPSEAVVRPLRLADGSLAGVLLTTKDARDSDRTDEERNRFLAMLAHELRNPLAAIKHALHLLRRRRVTDGDPTAEQALRIAERQAQSQARLLDDLLDASRLVLGKIALRLEPTDLVTIVRQATDAAQIALQSRAQMLRMQVPDHAAVAMADPVRLEQIVSNLLGNAIKYTAPGGEITVAVSVEAQTARLTVTDTGIGIEPELLAHVFDLFRQGDASRARPGGGLGIGLTVVRHLVELHGGTIEARSAGRGRGSTFVMSLPRADAVTVATPETAAAPRMRPRRILLVDDNRDARDLLRTTLELDGHRVHEAADGVNAVRLAVAWAPEIALVDIGLPGMDGYELARRIRKRLGKAVRLIALTGYGDAEARRLAVDAGFDDYLVKPVDPDTLADMLCTT
jgi:CheY-like chemotaxis protein/nitrogen-specific signal transduction histidine kinase